MVVIYHSRIVVNVVRLIAKLEGLARLNKEFSRRSVMIKNGKAKMTDADCPDQLCVHQKAASKNHESIICLPNKVVVEVDGSEESEFDAVAN